MNNFHLPNRRAWLGQMAGGIAAAGWMFDHPNTAWSDEKSSGKLIIRQEKPFNAEPPLPNLLDHWLTEYGTFFQRSHGNVPKIDAGGYQLTVEGMVDRPVKLSLGELKEKFPQVTTTATITCAGNRRSEFRSDKITGVQWHAGAISTAEWSGVSLAEILKHAGVQAGAKHVWFEGLDDVPEGGQTIAFGGSIPLEKAITATKATPGTLLAHTMNKQLLPTEHGAPLRGVVPGYIGARSVKWLGKIVVSDRPSPNHFIADVYKIVTKGTEDERKSTPPIYEHALNSVSCRWKLDDEKKRLQLSGFALASGHADCLIQKVEVSIDDGKSWMAAKLTSPQREFCWSFWEAVLPADAPGKTALVKATDSRGETQPREMQFNLKGYQYNAWHQIALKS